MYGTVYSFVPNLRSSISTKQDIPRLRLIDVMSVSGRERWWNLLILCVQQCRSSLGIGFVCEHVSKVQSGNLHRTTRYHIQTVLSYSRTYSVSVTEHAEFARMKSNSHLRGPVVGFSQLLRQRYPWDSFPSFKAPKFCLLCIVLYEKMHALPCTAR